MPNPKGNPQNLKPFQKGNPGGPGRPSAGASIREWFNALQGTPEAELRKISKDAKLAPAKRAAAIQWLRMIVVPDIADYQGAFEGKTLEELREAGVDTTAIKRFGTNKDSRSIELHDHVGQSIDRVIENTDGKPLQRQEITHDGSIRTQSEGEAAATTLLTRLTERLGIDPGRTD